ncbi:hypothetical protein [Georgenia yuyongxinii]
MLFQAGVQSEGTDAPERPTTEPLPPAPTTEPGPVAEEPDTDPAPTIEPGPVAEEPDTDPAPTTEPGPVAEEPDTDPAPTTEPERAAEPPSTTGCAVIPSACGYPDSSNTGVKDASALRDVPGDITSGPGWYYDTRGWINVNGNGAVLENIRTNATIDVVADNVTIRNVRSTVSGETFGIAIRRADNTTIIDSEIMPPSDKMRLLVGIKDIYGDANGTRVLRTEITRTSTGVQLGSGLIQDNYIHSMAMVAGDHVNGTTSNGGTEQLTLRHNTVLNSFDQTDAISLFQDFGTEENRLIEDNLLAGGGYTIYGGANLGKAPTANIVIRNNRISQMYFPRGGSFGPVTAFNPAGSGNTWTGNVWDETGATVNY